MEENQNIVEMNRQEDMAHKVAYMKSCITRQGFISGFSVAKLFNVSHEEFHDRLYDYYRFHGNPTNQPIIYRQDKNGYFLATSGSFPYDITTMRADLGYPTFGITSKHLSDLYMAFGEKQNEIEILLQALMNVIMVREGDSADAYAKAKQCVDNRKDFVYDFDGILEISEKDAEELFGRILIQDGLPNIKYRNLAAQNFPIITEGINRQFSKKHPDGINRGVVKEVIPAIQDDEKILWREIKI